MRKLIRLTRLGAHILSGALTLLLRFPWLDQQERERRVLRWSAGMLAILNVRIKVTGRLPALKQPGPLIVANHVSWLDIHLIHSVVTARFISKAEVRNWPVVGWMAAQTGTLFLERSRKTDAARMNGLMSDYLKAGECLALFPEGTTTDGRQLRAFYPSLFQPAVEAGAQVWPALIRYRRPDGSHSHEAAYHDDISLGTSLGRILAQEEIIAELDFLPPIETAGKHRRAVAAEAESLMRAALAPAGPDSAPGTDPHPPGDRP